MCTPTLGRTDTQNLLTPNPVTGKEGALTEPNPRRGAAKEELATSYPGSLWLAPLSGTFTPAPGPPLHWDPTGWNTGLGGGEDQGRVNKNLVLGKRAPSKGEHCPRRLRDPPLRKASATGMKASTTGMRSALKKHTK